MKLITKPVNLRWVKSDLPWIYIEEVGSVVALDAGDHEHNSFKKGGEIVCNIPFNYRVFSFRWHKPGCPGTSTVQENFES